MKCAVNMIIFCDQVSSSDAKYKQPQIKLIPFILLCEKLNWINIFPNWVSFDDFSQSYTHAARLIKRSIY